MRRFALVTVLFLCALPACATPTLKRVYAGAAGITSNVTGGGDAFKVYLDTAGPFAVATGDLIVVALKNHSTRTYTVTDDQTSTWTVATNCTANSLKYSMVYASAAGATTIITLTAGASDSNVSFYIYVFSGATSSGAATTDGVDCKTGITGPTIANNAITTTTDGDVLVQEAFDQSFPAGVGNTNTGVTYTSGWTGLHDEVFFGSVGQTTVQTTHGSITPSVVYSQSVSSDTFAAVAVAFKAGAGGTAPGTGIGIFRYATVPINSGSAASTVVTFPVANTGDAIVVVNEAAANGSSLTSVTDDASETFTAISCNATCVSDATPQIFFLCNATASNSRVITLHLTISANDLIGIYDIPGAAKTSGTACLDTAATAANSSSLTNTSSGATFHLTTSTTTTSDAPSIVPSTAHGLVIGAGNIGTGPATKCASVCTFDFIGATWTGNTADNNFFANGDFASHVYNATVATQNFSYSSINNSSSVGSGAVALIAAPVSSGPPPGQFPRVQ